MLNCNKYEPYDGKKASIRSRRVSIAVETVDPQRCPSPVIQKQKYTLPKLSLANVKPPKPLSQ